MYGGKPTFNVPRSSIFWMYVISAASTDCAANCRINSKVKDRIRVIKKNDLRFIG